MHSVIGSRVMAATTALASGAPGPAPSWSESSGSRSASANAPNEATAIPSWATPKPSAARSRLVATRAANALPSAIPSRKLASMVAKAWTLAPSRYPRSRVQSTS